MRYEEIDGPLQGWTFDENGTIYTASGYACNARTLECALWLFRCYGQDARKYLIRSDEAPGALRPLYESCDAGGETGPTRLKIEGRRLGQSPVHARTSAASNAFPDRSHRTACPAPAHPETHRKHRRPGGSSPSRRTFLIP